MSGGARSAPSALLVLLGVAEGLLLARLVLRLMAARPENPVVAAVLGLTGPLVGPLGWLDAGQPQFGAVLELSTLALVIVLPLIGVLIGAARRGQPGS